MPTTSGPVHRLKCGRCRCVLEVTADELLRFSSGEWPRCCVVPMVLEVDGAPVGPTEKTAVERPRRSTRKMFPD